MGWLANAGGATGPLIFMESQEIENLRAEAEDWRVKAGHFEMERDAMGIKAHALRVALLRYGRHNETCWLSKDPELKVQCTCGLDLALKL